MVSKLENYKVGANGTPVILEKSLEDGKGKYKPARPGEILVIPGKWFDGRSRRIAVYPEQSPRPYPLARGDTEMAPDAYRARDVLNLEGDYWAGLLARAFNLAAQMQTKDYIIIGMLALNIILSGVGIYVGWKIAHYIKLV